MIHKNKHKKPKKFKLHKGALYHYMYVSEIVPVYYELSFAMFDLACLGPMIQWSSWPQNNATQLFGLEIQSTVYQRV